MFQVNNKKAINNLALKNFKASKSRNIIAIIAIALTAILFTSLFTVGFGIIESFQTQTFRQVGGDAHGSFKNITEDEFDKLKNHPLVVDLAKNILCADEVMNEQFLKRHVELWYRDDLGLKWSFTNPIRGTLPKQANEIMMDEKSLQLLGVPAEIGKKVTLRLRIKSELEPVQREFTLSGILQFDNAMNVGFAIVSKEYLTHYSEELLFTGDDDAIQLAAIRADVKFKSPNNAAGKLQQVIIESGYSIDENDENYIDSNNNWAYMNSESFDLSTLLTYFLGLMLVIFTGYLIIYNIFQISVQRDIQIYGLLKTIGTTKKQIKRIISIQAMILSAIGIPMGLLIGFLIGKALLPLVLKISNITIGSIRVSAKPKIFLGATFFALLTIFLSTRKPGKIAGGISPIEAVRFSGNVEVKKLRKKSTSGGKVYKMAFANTLRNKKKTLIIVLSLSLSLVLLNSVFTLSRGFNLDKFLEHFVDTDFLMAHADYMNYRFNGAENSLSEQMITAVTAMEGLETGGRLYSNPHDKEMFLVDDPKNSQPYNRDLLGSYFTTVYGLEDFPISRLEVLAGEFDLERFKTGQYILEGIFLDDYGKPVLNSSHFEIGDQVTLHNYKGVDEELENREYTSRTFTVMAKVGIKTNALSSRSFFEYTFYLPANIYKTMVVNPGLMSYIFNVKDGTEQQFEAFLNQYTDTIEPVMNFESKQTYVDEFIGVQRMVFAVGSILSGIVGLIGLLNFTNSILTSILIRKREFATLQSIGLTKRQLFKLLIFEGGFYAVLTMVVSLVLSILFSIVVIGGGLQNLWMFSYQFTITPLLIAYPLLLVLSIIIPLVTYKVTAKQSIVERLREVD